MSDLGFYRKIILKKMKKNYKKIWLIKKTDLPLHPLRKTTAIQRRKRDI
jgi:hypothetical protein